MKINLTNYYRAYIDNNKAPIICETAIALLLNVSRKKRPKQIVLHFTQKKPRRRSVKVIRSGLWEVKVLESSVENYKIGDILHTYSTFIKLLLTQQNQTAYISCSILR
mgnify:FL=1